MGITLFVWMVAALAGVLACAAVVLALLSDPAFDDASLDPRAAGDPDEHDGPGDGGEPSAHPPPGVA